MATGSMYRTSAAGGNGSECAFFTGRDNSQAPFSYWHWENSTWEEVQPVPGPGGVCFFPGAACPSAPEGCCVLSPWAKSGYDRSSRIRDNVTNGVVWGPITVLLLVRYALAKRKARRQQAEESSEQEAERAEAGQAGAEAGGEKSSGMTRQDQIRWGFIVFLIIAAIAFSIFVAIFMANDVQAKLNVQDRNSMLAADAVLTPIGEVFAFLEDSMSVNIGHAMGSGDFSGMSSIISVGVCGGFLMGTMGASCMSLLALVPPVIRFLLAPAVDTHRSALPGCGLVEDAEGIVSTALPFWLLNVWAWPFLFSGMGIMGLLLGSKNLIMWVLGGAIRSLTIFLMWVLIDPQNLTLLGWANLVSQVVYVFIGIFSLYRDTSLRERLNVRFSCKDMLRFSMAFAKQKSALIEGFQCMVCDLTMQLGITGGVFVAAYMGMSELYQVSAMQSAMPMYSAPIVGLTIGFRFGGAAAVGARKFKEFRKLSITLVLMGVCSALAAQLTIHPFHEQMALKFAANACKFASSEQCLPAYIQIFGDGVNSDGTLQEAFNALAFGAVARIMYFVGRAGLYACFDFKFMAQVSGIVFLVVSIPGTIIACYVFQTASAVYRAMYLPMMVLAVIFLLRHLQNMCRMFRGEEGPWDRRAAGDTPASDIFNGATESDPQSSGDDPAGGSETADDSQSGTGSNSESDGSGDPPQHDAARA